MKFISIILVLVVVALAVLFLVKGSVALLLAAIAAVIVGFWFAVFTIPGEADS
jgi:hypothetical protein